MPPYQSGTPSVSENFLGFLVFIGIAAIGYLGYHAWPVSGYLIAGSLLWLAVAKRKNAWAKAAASTLASLNVGLALVAMILLTFNISKPRGEAQDVRKVETLLLWFDAHLPAWTRLPVWAVIGVLTLLTFLSYLVPRLRLVGRFLWLRKRLAQAVASIAVATTFTFFSDAAVFTPTGLYSRLLALYRDSKAREHKAIAKWLAADSLCRVVTDSPEQVRRYYQQVLQTVELLQVDGHAIAFRRKTAIMEDYARYRRTLYGTDRVAELSSAWPAAGPALPPRGMIVAVQARQEKTTVTAEEAAADAERGVKEILGEAVGAVSGPLKDLIGVFGDKLLKAELGELTNWVTDYLGKVAAKQIQISIEPLRDREVARLRQILGKSIDPQSSAIVGLLKAEVAAAQAKQKRLQLLAESHNTRDPLTELRRFANETLETADNARLLSEQGIAIYGSALQTAVNTDPKLTLRQGMEEARAAADEAKAAAERARAAVASAEGAIAKSNLEAVREIQRNRKIGRRTGEAGRARVK